MLTNSTVQEAVAATYSGVTVYALGALAGPAIVYGASQTIWRSLQAGNTGNAQVEGAWWTNAGVVYAPYSSGSSCNTGGIVQDNTSHLMYRSLVDSNTGNALSDATKWELIGPTNRWAMFDYVRSTASTVPLTLTVVWTPGQRVNSLGLAGIVANSYSFTVTSVIGGGTVYSSSGSLNTRETLGWYDYFFGEFSTQESLAFFDIPPYSDAIFTLTLTATTGNVSLGACVFGIYVYVGETQYEAVSDVLNFSQIERDEDTGEATLIATPSVPKTMQRVHCEKARVNKARQVRKDLNGVPAFWYGVAESSDGYFEILSILGIYNQFSIDVSYPETAVITLELEEI